MGDHEKKIKVMALVPTMRTGGAERVISLLLAHLDRRRFEPELAIVYDAEVSYAIPADVPVHILADEPQMEGFRGIDLPPVLAARFADSAAWLDAAAARLASVVDRRRPDVIISSPLWASILAIVAHDSFPASTRLVNRVDAPPSVSLAQSDLQELFTHYMRTRFNLADRVVAVSQAVGRDLVENFAVDPDRIEVLHNPVDIARIQSLAEEPVSDPAFGDDVPVVLFVGRLERVKGLEYLLRATAKVVEKVPVRLALVGDGSQGGYLRALSEHLGIAAHVHFLGRQANPFKYLRRATAFVLPSLSEGMPNVLLEAMTSGCPVIASDIAGGITREVLDEGAAGLIVPRQDEDALADAMLEMLRDDGLRKRFVGAGLQRATEFDLPRIMQRNQDVLVGVATAGPLEMDPRGRGDGALPRRDRDQERITVGETARGGVWKRIAAMSRTPFGPRVALKTASAAAILRNRGWRSLAFRALQELRYALAVRLHPLYRVSSPAPASLSSRDEKGSAKTRLMILVPSTDDESTRTGTSVLLRHLDREAFELSLVRVFAGHPSHNVPGDVRQRVLQPRAAGPRSGRDIPEALLQPVYGKDLDRIDAAVRGLVHLAGELEVDAILGQGFYPSLLAAMAKDRLPDSTAVIAMMRSHSRDFSGGAPLGDLHAGLVTAYFGGADMILVPDERIRADLIGTFGVDVEKVTVMPDPIDTHNLVPPEGVAASEHPWLRAEIPFFVDVAMPGAAAELAYLLPAIASAKRREDVRCVILGDEGSRADIEERAVELDISDSICFLSQRDPSVDLILNASAIVQSARVADDHIPSAIVEAMALGCPVISTRTSAAVCDLLGDGEYGLLVAARDPEALADGILQIVWHAALRRDLARKGPERLKPFVAEGIVPRYEQVIAAAITRSRGRCDPAAGAVGMISA